MNHFSLTYFYWHYYIVRVGTDDIFSVPTLEGYWFREFTVGAWLEYFMTFLQSDRGCLSWPKELLLPKSVYLHRCPLFERPFSRLSRLFTKLSKCFPLCIGVVQIWPESLELQTISNRLWWSIGPWCFIDSLSSRFFILMTPPSCWSISTSRWSNSSERDIVPSSLLSTSANQTANFTIAKSQIDDLVRI